MKLDMLLFALLICSVLITNACDSDYHSVRKQLSVFESSVVVLPPDLLLISNGDIINTSDQNTANIFFIYHESVDCSDCFSRMIASLNRIITISYENNLEVKCVISPKPGDEAELIRKLNVIKLPFDFYIDYTCSFHALNPNLPNDQRFYMFCTDNESKPVYVGDPSTNKHNYNLFLRSLKQHRP